MSFTVTTRYLSFLNPLHLTHRPEQPNPDDYITFPSGAFVRKSSISAVLQATSLERHNATVVLDSGYSFQTTKTPREIQEALFSEDST